ncbi:MAG: aspartate/glutamate racemase family protein [Lautropia sp.]
MRLLLVNPNTSVQITERLARSARVAMHADTDTLSALTAPEGPAVVRNAVDLREAERSAMAMVDAHRAAHDAVLLAISLDGAAVALRARHPDLPVVGMTEAALFVACLRAERVGLLTVGAAMLPLYRERVAAIGIASRVAAYEAPDLPAAFAPDAAAVDPQVLDTLAGAVARMRGREGCGAVVLAGAVLCGYADALTRRASLPVIDGVSAAVGQARLLLGR